MRLRIFNYEVTINKGEFNSEFLFSKVKSLINKEHLNELCYTGGNKKNKKNK